MTIKRDFALGNNESGLINFLFVVEIKYFLSEYKLN